MVSCRASYAFNIDIRHGIDVLESKSDSNEHIDRTGERKVLVLCLYYPLSLLSDCRSKSHAVHLRY